MIVPTATPIHDSRFHGLLNYDLKRGAPALREAITRSSGPGAPAAISKNPVSREFECVRYF
jgi:hypothetical protein